MSDKIGSFINNDNGESGKSSNLDGVSHVENGSGGTQGNVSEPTSIPNIFISEPATERINPRTEFGNSGGEPRRTKSGKIDRRTRAGRGGTETETPGPIRQPGKLISLEKAILSLHDMASEIFGIPELQLSEAEAAAMNEAVLDVSKYYVQSFDPKKVAIFNLAMCCGGIYTTRIMAYRNRLEKEGKDKLRIMPNPQTQPQQSTQRTATTLEEYLGGMPPAEGAGGY